MIQNNLTPKELAAKCQIPIDRVYAFLNAKNQTLGTGRKIAEGLACNVADLLDTPKEIAPEPFEPLSRRVTTQRRCLSSRRTTQALAGYYGYNWQVN